MVTLIPAYGRDYKNKAAVLADYEAGKDFKLADSGQYCSIRDFPSDTVLLRYGKLQKILSYKPR